MKRWQGKSKGNVLGYKIFVYCIKKIGLKTAYLILFFVTFYYFLFAWDSNRSLYFYLRKRLRYSLAKTILGIYKNYYVFGQVLIDKIAVSSGLRNDFTYQFDGIEILKQILKQKKGGILVSAHIGNFEIAKYFFSDIDVDFQINLVTTDIEHEKIKNYFSKISVKSNIKFIIVREDLSHIFDINNCLSNNEIICFTGDRYFEGTKTLRESLLGKEASFPAGPYLLASRLKVPVAFVYVMKEKKQHYHLYARQAEIKHRDARALLKAYCFSVESMLAKYPFQWFNYFDFWEDYKDRRL